MYFLLYTCLFHHAVMLSHMSFSKKCIIAKNRRNLARKKSKGVGGPVLTLNFKLGHDMHTLH